MSKVSLAPARWCPAGDQAFQTSFSDPGGSAARIVGWALEYMHPLDTWLDQLVGDEAQVRALAADWTGASRELATVDSTCTLALRDIADMQGRSIRAQRAAIEQVQAIARDAHEWTDAAAASLALASRIVEAVHDAVVGALSELAGIVASLFDFSLASLNPLEKWEKLTALIDHVDAFIEVIAQLIDDMLAAFGDLVRLIRSLEPLLDEALLALRELMSRVVDAAGFPLGSFYGSGLGAFLGFVVGGPLGGLVGGAGGFVLGGALGDAGGGVLSDWLAPDLPVGALDRDRLSLEQQRAYDQAMASRDLDSLTEFVTQNGHTDVMGGQDRTVIDIKKVIGADGQEHWVVSLPSTQDWNAGKGIFDSSQWADTLADYPATNDLDTNIALMLSDHPELATQYQRGVYEAMRQAGVPAGAPVVYTGFSQGGIMSASLAADTATPYRPIGIVTTGAPVDRFDMPDSVEVVAFAHRSDPVAAIDDYMDAAGRAVQGGGIATGNPLLVGGGGLLLKGHAQDATMMVDDPTAIDGVVPNVHSVDGYRQSVAEWEAAHPDQASAAIALVGGTVVDHQTYSFQE